MLAPCRANTAAVFPSITRGSRGACAARASSEKRRQRVVFVKAPRAEESDADSEDSGPDGEMDDAGVESDGGLSASVPPP